MTNNVENDKEAVLSALKEEYILVQSKKNMLKDHNEIIKEIFITVKNRLEIDPLITDKLKLKQGKKEQACCLIY